MADNILGQPLQGGTLQLLSPTASKEEQTGVINDIINQLNGILQTQVYADGTSKRLLIGYQKGGWDGGASDFGIKMSISGVDVTTATAAQLLFSMSINSWTWRNNSGQLVKQFNNQTGTDAWYDLATRNYVNVGNRPSTSTYGFEMAKPGVDLGNAPI
jgi:hypothetical protein